MITTQMATHMTLMTICAEYPGARQRSKASQTETFQGSSGDHLDKREAIKAAGANNRDTGSRVAMSQISLRMLRRRPGGCAPRSTAGR